MLKQIAESKGKYTHDHKGQIIPGSPLQYNWEKSNVENKGWGTAAKPAAEKGEFDTLILTEAVPLDNHLKYSNSTKHLKNFHELFSSHPNFDNAYLYETWHCIGSGTAKGCAYDQNDDKKWEDRLKDDLKKWEDLAAAAKISKNESNVREVKLIPAGQGMFKLKSAIDAGKISGKASIKDVFLDDIHLTNFGNYYVALIMYSVIYGESPEGASSSFKGKWGQPIKGLPSEKNAETLQKLAWETVKEYKKNK